MNDEYRTMYARHRKAAGLTQEKAAELLGVAVRTLANWEAGIYVPPDDKVALMCDAYPAPTLALEAGRLAQVQCRYRFASGAVGASRIYDENVYAVLKEGEI